MRLVMEDARKKRRLNDDQDDEEVKMEKFFALIRSVKGIRDQLHDGGEFCQGEKQRPTAAAATTDDDKVKFAAWQPTFEPEDFGEHGALCKADTTTNQGAGPSTSRRASDEENNKGADHHSSNHFDNGRIGLDLNLSL